MVTAVIRRAYADCPSVGQLHYRTAGASSSPVLLLLHQSPSSSAMYEVLMARLCQQFYLVAPDTPGFGASDPVANDSIESYAGAIGELLQRLNISECFVFGHHTGASIAVQLAYDHPGLCRALSLSGPPLLNVQQRRQLPAKAQPFDADERGSHVLRMWQRVRDKERDAPLALTLRETLLALQCGDKYQAAYHAVVAQDFATQLASLSCPVQCFAARNDVLKGAVAGSVERAKKGYLTEISSTASSYVCDRDAEELGDVLSDFFNRLKNNNE